MRRHSVFGGLEQRFEDVLGLIDQTIQSTRTLTFEISPPILYELGLEPAIDWLCRQVQKKHGLKAEMSSSGHASSLPDDVRITLFRSVQELLLNAVKHGRASVVRVELTWDEGGIRIEVRDDGVGFDTGREASFIMDKGAFGLFSIRERIRSREGSLAISSAPGGGTSVTLMIPLSRETKPDGDVR
jgi:signal transduction histidine kinase